MGYVFLCCGKFFCWRCLRGHRSDDGKAREQTRRIARRHTSIFGAHQALEGVVWLTEGEASGRCAGYSFAIIAFCLWPIYIPLAARLSECDATRRKLMLPFLVLGVVVSLAAASVLHSGLSIDFAAQHIKYLPGRRYPPVFDYLYAAAVVGPLLLHRSAYIELFGCLIAAFFAVSLLVFNPARYSVWCFFAAASSIVLYFFVATPKRAVR